MKKLELFNINVTDIEINDLLKLCLLNIKKNKKNFIITLNSLMVISYLFNKKFQKAVEKADLIIPDGYGIVLAGKLFRKKINHQIPGIDLMYKLFGIAYEKRLSVFLLGSSWRVMQKAYNNLVKWFPKVKFLGKYSGYFDNDEERKVITGINKLNPDILFVGMGSPKQEIWIMENLEKLNVKIIIGIGGSLDVVSGFIKRAPEKWRQKHLEWLYRSLSSPAKLFNLIKIMFYFIIMIYFKLFKNKNMGKIS